MYEDGFRAVDSQGTYSPLLYALLAADQCPENRPENGGHCDVAVAKFNLPQQPSSLSVLESILKTHLCFLAFVNH